MPRCLRTRLSWTTSSGFGWLVPSILRLRLLHGRHRILEPVVLEKGPRTPGAVGPEGGDPPLATAKFWNCNSSISDRKDSRGSRQPHPSTMQNRGTSACMVLGVPFSCGFSDISCSYLQSLPNCKVYVRRQNGSAILAQDCGPWVLRKFRPPTRPYGFSR